jgi:hypothetical protein
MGSAGAPHERGIPGKMRPDGDGVQFFDLVEVYWKSASANASSARFRS